MPIPNKHVAKMKELQSASPDLQDRKWNAGFIYVVYSCSMLNKMEEEHAVSIFMYYGMNTGKISGTIKNSIHVQLFMPYVLKL